MGLCSEQSGDMSCLSICSSSSSESEESPAHTDVRCWWPSAMSSSIYSPHRPAIIWSKISGGKLGRQVDITRTMGDFLPETEWFFVRGGMGIRKKKKKWCNLCNGTFFQTDIAARRWRKKERGIITAMPTPGLRPLASRHACGVECRDICVWTAHVREGPILP